MKRLAIGIGAVVVIGGASYFLFFNTPSEPWPVSPNSAATTTAAQAQVAPVRDVPAGAKEYSSTKYHFSTLYPDNLTVAEESNGVAMTITFQNIKTVEGFQIFVVPYSESQVSEKRFKQDEPSGVRKNVANITVDGVVGAAFDSTDVSLGDTREVWFIKGGFLYEVTTLKSLEPWLTAIMSTWQFI